LSGIPRDWAQGDIVTQIPDPSVIGLPPATTSDLPKCDSYRHYRPCTEKEFLKYLRGMHPLFEPNQQSTYSNVAFELLGLVLAKVTGVTYEEHIKSAILDPLEMTGSSFSKPPDSVAVLPKNESWYWDVDEGIQNPTGGLFAPSADMSKFLRYILTHFNDITHALNWFQPASFTAGVNSFYGTPWEILRTDKILRGSQRAVTFFTKSGGLPGYRTIIILVPEYELGITILTAGEGSILDSILEAITAPLIQAADRVAKRQIQDAYAGVYKASHLNSSIQLSYSVGQGLEITNWISNGTDMLQVIPAQFNIPASGFHAQVIPTLLFRDEKQKRGERWRVVILVDSPKSESPGRVWDDFCISDVDTLTYAGKPLNEIVFWDKNQDGKFETVELTAFRISMSRGENASTGEQLVTQDL